MAAAATFYNSVSSVFEIEATVRTGQGIREEGGGREDRAFKFNANARGKQNPFENGIWWSRLKWNWIVTNDKSGATLHGSGSAYEQNFIFVSNADKRRILGRSVGCST